jgi:REP element-mobilizing transposase RayT
MSVKLTQTEKDQTYFCSFTCLDWISLFEITNLYDEIYKWFDILVQNNHQLLGFVIMPNHLHLLVHVNQSDKSINTILANGKRFLAYEIVNRLKEQGNTHLLKKLSESVSPEERKRKKKHRVFQPSSDIKPCFSEKFVIQKLDYIHYNPVKGRWSLAEDFTKYAHSSAMFYELNVQHPKIKITHFKNAGVDNRIASETREEI